MLRPTGSTAQVGVINERRLLVTLKTDPDPGTVDIVSLHDGAVTGAAPVAVSAPAGTLTPFGFSVYGDGTAVITLAHSNQDGLFRNGAFTSVTDAGQGAPCWMTKVGKICLHGEHGEQDNQSPDRHREPCLRGQPGRRHHHDRRAPSDIDADEGVLGVIDHAAGQSHLSLFTYNKFGELTASGAPINLGVANANGVAIMAPTDRDEYRLDRASHQ